MPIYEYRCNNGHTLEILQRMSDAPLSSCTACDAPVQRVFHPVAVHFKGSGFYSTDYGRNHGKGSDAKGDGDASSTTSKSDDAKPAAKEKPDKKPKTASSESKSSD